MKDFLASYCQRNDSRINHDLFDRSFDRPLVDYIVDTCKNLEVFPAIKLESWELITDQTKIRTTIDKHLVKDPKIKNNKSLERLASPNQSLYDLLVLNFRVKAKGQESLETRKLRIPKPIKGKWYIRGGKKVLPLIQIVDNSTFVKGNILNFKATLYPVKLYTTKIKLKFTDGEAMSVQHFHIDLFKKVTNPFYYYLAAKGIENLLESFRMENIISVVDDILDEDNYLYIKINDHVFLEVHEKGFYAHEFVGKFIGTLFDALNSDRTKITLKDVYSKTYWLERLAEVFSKKRNEDKGERVLISFKKVADPYTKARLKLRKFHKKNTSAIIRWMMVNYDDLLKKDSNDLLNKRMRANETQAYYFDSYITRNVYSLLNTDNPPFEKYIKMLRSINENTLLRSSSGSAKGPKKKGKAAKGKKESTSSMFRYERYNDFDAIELTRFTLKGPTGLNGGKKKISLRYRDIYPSHLGRYDLNVCSSSDPGLTGYLTANVKYDPNGYFDLSSSEPDVFDKVIDKLLAKKEEPGYRAKRDEYLEMQLSRDEEGFIVLKRKMSDEQWTHEFAKDPEKYGLYWYYGEMRLIPKMDNLDPKGFVQLIPITAAEQRSNNLKKEEFVRDEDGFILLEPVMTKMARQQKIDKIMRGNRKRKSS